MVLADRDFCSRSALAGEKEPNEPDGYVRRVVTQPVDAVASQVVASR